MVRMETMSAGERRFHENYACPSFSHTPFVIPDRLNRLRVAIVSTAGLHTVQDDPFDGSNPEKYRVIPKEIPVQDLVMSHVSVNYDRSGFYQDFNVVFPLDRLKELQDEGFIASVASRHYSFMGAENPMTWRPAVEKLADQLRQDHVDAVLLVPV